MTDVLIKRGNLDTETYIQGESHVKIKADRDWGDVTDTEEHQRLLENHQKLGEIIEPILPHSSLKEPNLST